MRKLLSRLRHSKPVSRVWAALNRRWNHLLIVRRDAWIHHHDIPIFLHDQPDWHIPRGPPR